MPLQSPEICRHDLISRLEHVGRLQFELEQLVKRCAETGTTPSIGNLKTLIDVAGVK
jgi:hypothetical protein